MTFDRITQNPAVQGGKPCVRDTGITVGQILGAFALGYNRFAILKANPSLSHEDIDAVFTFAKQQVRAGEMPDVETPAGLLTVAGFRDFRAPDAASDRLELLIRRSKIRPLPPEEETEIEDCLRLDHI